MTEIQDRITSFWSTVASGYEAYSGNVPARDSDEYDAWVRLFAELLPPAPADVLDVATGTGFAAKIEAKLGHRVTGIDLSESMLAEANAAAARDGLTIRFKLEDAIAPTLAPASFDALTSRHLIWTLRDVATALANWRRLLRPGGRLIAIDSFQPMPEPEAENDLFSQYYTREMCASLPGWKDSSPDSMAALIAAAGFKDVAMRPLDEIHRLALNPGHERPSYALTARA